MKNDQATNVKKETLPGNSKSAGLAEFWDLLMRMDPPDRMKFPAGHEKKEKTENVVEQGLYS